MDMNPNGNPILSANIGVSVFNMTGNRHIPSGLGLKQPASKPQQFVDHLHFREMKKSLAEITGIFKTGKQKTDRSPHTKVFSSQQIDDWNQLIAVITQVEASQATGRLDVTLQAWEAYSFHFQQGRLFWVGGGNHPYRRWKRHLSSRCQADETILAPRASCDARSGAHYRHLGKLVRQGILSPQEAAAAVAAIASEVAHDLFIEAQRLNAFDRLELSWAWVVSDSIVLDRTISVANDCCLARCLTSAYQNSQAWQQAGLTPYSPNFSLRILDRQELQARTTPEVYRVLVSWLNGQATLWDLSARVKNLDPLGVARMLLPLVQEKVLAFEKVGDLKLPATAPASAPTTAPSQDLSSPPRIVCIDDSPQIHQIVGGIVRSTGCRFVGIKNPVEALGTLAALKPDLIFLDLVMPQLGGYELCAHLRQTSQFRETPIIILTGTDGLFDSLRVKIVGATDFIAKPIEPDGISAALQSYLPQWANRAERRLHLACSSQEISG